LLWGNLSINIQQINYAFEVSLLVAFSVMKSLHNIERSKGMIKKSLLLIFVHIMISDCSAQNGSAEFKGAVQRLEQLINDKDISGLKREVEVINKTYDKNEWKIQLLGDEGEYEGLHESIGRFIAAVEIEDLETAKTELGAIKAFLKDIY